MESRVTLEYLTKDHLNKTFEWISDYEFRKKFMMRGEISWARHINYFKCLIADNNQAAFAIILNGIHIGNCGFKHLDKRKNSGELWLYIGDKNSRGSGSGALALSLLLKNGTDHIGLRDIYVHVAEDNDSALNLYKKNSFFEHGECSDEWHDREAKMIRLHWKAQ